MLAVVSVDLISNNLFFRGDNDSNETSLSLDSNNIATIEGNADTRIEFSKNKETRINLTSLDNVFVHMGAGDDLVAFDMQSQGIAGNISIQLANGNDTLFLMGDPETANAIGGDLRIHCSSGSDLVFVSDMSIDDDLCVTGGRGDDLVMLQSINVHDKTLISSQAGDDSIAIADSEFGGKTKIAMGIHNDHFESVSSKFKKRFKLNSSDGIDSSSISDTNELLSSEKIRSVEQQDLSKADNIIDSLRGSFNQNLGSMNSALTGKIQNAATKFGRQLGIDFIELNLDSQSQTVQVADPTPSLSVQWDQVTQLAVAETDLSPTVASRLCDGAYSNPRCLVSL